MKKYTNVDTDALLLTALNQVMRFYGPAQVSLWLGYEDPNALKMWSTRSKIPERMRDRLIDLLNIKLTKKAKQHFLETRGSIQ